VKLDPREARDVLRRCHFGALASHSVRLAGYPFVSHVPLALDGGGRPVMLLSRLAEHTRNLAADPRASLMVSPPGEDPQAQPRLTLLGDIGPIEVSATLRERYLRYHPDGADYLGFGDFRFYRLEPQRVRLVGGFARAGWIEPAEWAGRPLMEEDEAVALAKLAPNVPTGWETLGLDWEGLDLRRGSGEFRRLAWQHAPADIAALTQAAGAALTQLAGAAP
jgi:heme oxygenase (biliverdin-IX-beta and delta-forming)